MSEQQKSLSTERTHTGLVLRDMDSMRQFCELAVAAGIVTKGSDPRSVVARTIMQVQAGAEMGLGPMESLTAIAIVQGRPAPTANLLARKIKESGRYDYRILSHDDSVCEIEFFLLGKSVGRSSFTIDDAKSARINGGENWNKYPRNMLFARALSNGFRWYCPDAIGGGTCYVAEELADIETSEPTARKPDRQDNVDGAGDERMASQQQLKKIYAMVRERHLAKDGVSEYISARFGCASSKDLTSQAASDLIEALESGDVESYCSANYREPGQEG